MLDVEENDIILEMLEVFINSILYLRGVYPTSVFRRRKMYSTAVFVSIYQKLNDYITSVLTAAHQLKKLGKLMQLELIIYKKNSRNCFMPLEKYLFDVDLKASLTNSGPTSELSSTSHSDRYLIEFENIVRDALIRLDQMSKNLKTIDCADDEDCCFKIEIQTTESGFVELTNKTNATNEKFNWRLSSSDGIGKDSNKQKIVPIANMKFANIHAVVDSSLVA